MLSHGYCKSCSPVQHTQLPSTPSRCGSQIPAQYSSRDVMIYIYIYMYVCIYIYTYACSSSSSSGSSRSKSISSSIEYAWMAWRLTQGKCFCRCLISCSLLFVVTIIRIMFPVVSFSAFQIFSLNKSPYGMCILWEIVLHSVVICFWSSWWDRIYMTCVTKFESCRITQSPHSLNQEDTEFSKQHLLQNTKLYIQATWLDNQKIAI